VNGYIDIHAHVLPGIDDGPSDLDGSLAMLRAAAQSGTTVLVATPHLRADFPDVHVHELADRCADLRERIAGEGLGLELLCGGETTLTWALDASDADLTAASIGQRGTDLLIETPSTSSAGLEMLLYQVRLRGFRITLAHPERSRDFQHDLAPLARLVDQGILLQVNADSILGNPRRSQTARLAEDLCRTGLAHVIASDGHRGSSWRPVTRLAEAARAAGGLVGPDRACWMTSDVPGAIVAGETLPEAPAVLMGRRRLALWPRR